MVCRTCKSESAIKVKTRFIKGVITDECNNCSLTGVSPLLFRDALGQVIGDVGAHLAQYKLATGKDFNSVRELSNYMRSEGVFSRGGADKIADGSMTRKCKNA